MIFSLFSFYLLNERNEIEIIDLAMLIDDPDDDDDDRSDGFAKKNLGQISIF